MLRDFVKLKKTKKIDGGLTGKIKKKLESRPKIIVNLYMCILLEYTWLKVVSYYDLSVLSMSVRDVQKKCVQEGGWGELYPVLFGIFGMNSCCAFNIMLGVKRWVRSSSRDLKVFLFISVDANIEFC